MVWRVTRPETEPGLALTHIVADIFDVRDGFLLDRAVAYWLLFQRFGIRYVLQHLDASNRNQIQIV